MKLSKKQRFDGGKLRYLHFEYIVDKGSRSEGYVYRLNLIKRPVRRYRVRNELVGFELNWKITYHI